LLLPVNRPIQVLQVEDSQADAELLIHALKREGLQLHSECVETAGGLTLALQRNAWDVVISDFTLPEFNAFEALRIVRESSLDIPFIVVCGNPDDQAAVALLKAGANDYLQKDHSARLGLTITREIQGAALRAEQRETTRSTFENRDRLAVAAVAANLGVFDCFPQTGNADFSPGFREQMGMGTKSRESWELFLACIHPEDRPRIEQSFSAAFKSSTGQYLAEFRTAALFNGKPRWIAAQGRVFFDPPGEPVRFTGAVSDVTARRAAEEALHYQNELTRGISDQALDGILVSDERGIVIYCNREAARMFGYEKSGLIGQSMHEMVHHHREDGSFFPRAECPMVHAAADLNGTGTLTGHETLMFRKDGSEVFVSCSLSPLDVDGIRVGSVTSIRDVTARKNAERALRESDGRYRALAAANIVGIIISTADSLLEANDFFLRLLGYTQEEYAAGMLDWPGCMPAEHKGISDRMRELALLEGSRPAFEKEFIHRDGRRIPVLSGGVAIEHSGQRCVFSIVVDLTERNALEAQIHHAQRLESVGQLAGGVAHDFNNLLTIILGYSDIMAGDSKLPDAFRQHLGEVNRAALRGASLTRQLLAFGRMQISDPTVFPINDAVREAERLLRRALPETIEITMSLEPDLAFIRADPGDIQQVLMNLAVNARDAMPQGGGLHIETSQLTVDNEWAALCHGMEPGRYVQLVVSDSGVGMTAAVRDRVFEPFFTTKDTDQGTGLGLSTVYGIVKQAGGAISVHSAPGVGSTFRIILPEHEHSEVGIQPDEIPIMPGSGTILLVEDEAAVRNYVRRTLELNGYVVLDAANSKRALEIAGVYRGGIQLLLTDFVLPGLTGSEVARQIMPLRPAMRVVLMSGFAEKLGRRADESLPFLQKPFTSGELLRKIQSVLRPDLTQSAGFGG
jgi:two-component system cell cycle sensor histidine kinase/response regulator CckA